MKPIFLSASVPVKSSSKYLEADPYLIKESLAALLEVSLGRRMIVWGGHPSITSIIHLAASRYNVAYRSAVTLYQSRFFADIYPEENQYFESTIVEVDKVSDELQPNVDELRRRMFTEHTFQSAVFIGGMEGVLAEYEMLKKLQPNTEIIAFPTTGEAAKLIFEREKDRLVKLKNSIDFTFWLYQLLEIDMRQERDLDNWMPGENPKIRF